VNKGNRRRKGAKVGISDSVSRLLIDIPWLRIVVGIEDHRQMDLQV